MYRQTSQILYCGYASSTYIYLLFLFLIIKKKYIPEGLDIYSFRTTLLILNSLSSTRAKFLSHFAYNFYSIAHFFCIAFYLHLCTLSLSFAAALLSHLKENEKLQVIYLQFKSRFKSFFFISTRQLE